MNIAIASLLLHSQLLLPLAKVNRPIDQFHNVVITPHTVTQLIYSVAKTGARVTCALGEPVELRPQEQRHQKDSQVF